MRAALIARWWQARLCVSFLRRTQNKPRFFLFFFRFVVYKSLQAQNEYWWKLRKSDNYEGKNCFCLRTQQINNIFHIESSSYCFFLRKYFCWYYFLCLRSSFTHITTTKTSISYKQAKKRSWIKIIPLTFSIISTLKNTFHQLHFCFSLLILQSNIIIITKQTYF